MEQPKTAQEVLREFEEKFARGMGYQGEIDVEELRAFILSAMRQAADAVISAEVPNLETYLGTHVNDYDAGLKDARQDQLTRRDNFFKSV